MYTGVAIQERSRPSAPPGSADRLLRLRGAARGSARLQRRVAMVVRRRARGRGCSRRLRHRSGDSPTVVRRQSHPMPGGAVTYLAELVGDPPPASRSGSVRSRHPRRRPTAPRGLGPSRRGCGHAVVGRRRACCRRVAREPARPFRSSRGTCRRSCACPRRRATSGARASRHSWCTRGRSSRWSRQRTRRSCRRPAGLEPGDENGPSRTCRGRGPVRRSRGVG